MTRTVPVAVSGASEVALQIPAAPGDPSASQRPSHQPPPRSSDQRHMSRRLRSVLLLAAALVVPLGSTALSREVTQATEVPVGYAPIAGEPACLAQGRLRLPPGWIMGDVAALVLHRRSSAGSGSPPAVVSPDTAALEIVAGTSTDCGGRGAADPRDEMLAALAALLEHGAGTVFLVGFEEDARAALGAAAPVDDHIAFCLPRAWAAEPCFCSLEGVETPITPGQFILLMRERRSSGATSAAELRAAMQHAREVCGDQNAGRSVEASGSSPVRARLQSHGRRTRAAVRSDGLLP